MGVEMESQTNMCFHFHHQRRGRRRYVCSNPSTTSMFFHFILSTFINSFIFCKVLLLGSVGKVHKKLVIAILVLMLEIVSVLAEFLGGNRWPFHLLAFLLSAICCFFVNKGRENEIINNMTSATTTASVIRADDDHEKQLNVVGITFATIQLIAKFVLLVLAVFGVKINRCYNNIDFVFTTVFAIIDVCFAFKIKNKKEAHFIHHPQQYPYESGLYDCPWCSDIY